jgi:hypothetical protein
MEPRDRYAPLTQHEVNQAVYRLSPAGTQEVADLVGVSREVADRRLRRLEDEGTIWAKKVGPTMVWMHPWIMREPGWEPTGFFARITGRPTFGTTSRAHQMRHWERP